MRLLIKPPMAINLPIHGRSRDRDFSHNYDLPRPRTRALLLWLGLLPVFLLQLL
jgi:hypothetical protein